MKQITFNCLKRYIFLILTVIGFSTPMFADATYTEPSYTCDTGKEFDKLISRYATEMSLTCGKNADTWTHGGTREFYNVLSDFTIDAKAGETVTANFKANNPDYDSKNSEDLRWTIATLHIDWDRDGIFESSEIIAGKTGNEMGSGNDIQKYYGNREYIFDITKDIVIPEGTTPGKVRVRLNYTNAWIGTEPVSAFATKSKEGIVYDFDINITSDTYLHVNWEIPKNGTIEVKYVDSEEQEQPVENGVTEIPSGSTIKVIPTADAENGYVLKSLSYQLGEEAPVSLTEPYEFVLNDNATINAEFGYPTLNWSTSGAKVFFGILKVSTPDNENLVNINQTSAKNGSVEIPAGTTVTVLATVPEEKINILEGKVYLDDEIQKLDENAKCTFTMPAKTTSLKVIYDEIKYSYNVTKEGEGDVQVKVGNMSSGAATGEIAKDNTFTVIATPKEGWKVKSIEVKINDEIVTGEEFKATGDVEIKVVFEPITYTVNITQPEKGATISVKVKDGEDIENGTIIDYGTELEISINTETGYKVKYLFVNSSPQDKVDDKYYFTANDTDTETIEISAELEAEKYALEIADVEGADIIVKVQGDDEIVKPGTKAVTYGQVLLISIAPNEGYIVKSLSVNGEIKDAVDGKYTHTVDGAVSITAVVEKDPSSINSAENVTFYYNAAEETLYTGNAKSVKVYDLNGRVVLNTGNQETVTLAELADGIYTAIIDNVVLKLKK